MNINRKGSDLDNSIKNKNSNFIDYSTSNLQLFNNSLSNKQVNNNSNINNINNLSNELSFNTKNKTFVNNFTFTFKLKEDQDKILDEE